MARRGGLSPTRITQVLAGENPGSTFCEGVARALNLPPETVFRHAGLLPPEPNETATVRELVQVFTQLPDDDQERALIYLRAMLEHQREEERGRVTSQTVAGSAGV